MYLRSLPLLFVLLLGCGIVEAVYAQHNGDQLAFQGLAQPNDLDIRALGRGGAGTAESGHLGSLFSNPAGLAGVGSLQLGVSAKYARDHWQEEQVWLQNRYFPVVPFLMEGLYEPDPAHDGVYYDSLLLNVISPYEFENPVMGEEVFDDDRADWRRSSDRFPLNYIAAAVPLSVGGRNIVFAGSYARRYDVSDFDRNETSLDPHFGYLTPAMIAPDVDTLRVNWWRYERSRQGGINSYTGAIAVEATSFLDFGLSAEYVSGDTEDLQRFDKFGVLEFAERDNAFFHSDDLHQRQGTSAFDAVIFSGGVNADIGRLRAGLDVQFPHRITRSWAYDEVVRLDGTETQERVEGEDVMSIPAVVSFGLRVAPRDDFILYGDIRRVPFGDATFDMDPSASVDSTYRSSTHWIDQSSYGFGIDYAPIDRLTLRVGYRAVPEVFVPTGAANRRSGPGTDGYTAGLSLDLFFGRLDVAYEHRRLKYWDSYQTNTNYSLQVANQVLVGYTVTL